MFFDMKQISLLTLVILAVISFWNRNAEACSCLPAHPQTHFCNDDYVVIIRVLRKSRHLVADKVAYKVEIKKSYKMNSEAHKMLKHGRILTPAADSMCGVKLELGKLYMISGRAPYLNICSYVKEYMKMSIIERRGFSGVYRKGCNCQIQTCFKEHCPVKNDTCSWSPFAKCETDFSACMPAAWRTPEGVIAKCHWRRTPSYKACMRDP